MKFIEEDKPLSSDLPWVNEYINTVGQAGDIALVERLKVTPKGMLVSCQLFKGFIFREQKTFEFLYQAMQYWKEEQRPGYALYGQATSSGKIAIALEDSLDALFLVDKNGGVDIRLKEATTPSPQIESNPFIRTSTSVPTTSKKKTRIPADTTGQETAS